MENNNNTEKENEEIDEGFLEFTTTLEHGLQLHQQYMASGEGKSEYMKLSPALKDILAHYMKAAEHWVNNDDEE